ncbi:VOC family protein [Sinorhizobium meliloti]|uniref:VOC family protein n=1 Tax=Rhizobium meliloti TaxID=382 RepID=UPI003F5CC55A
MVDGNEVQKKGSANVHVVVPELSVSDWRKSLRFYGDVLGFNIDYQRPENGFAYLRLGPAELMIDQIGSEKTLITGICRMPIPSAAESIFRSRLRTSPPSRHLSAHMARHSSRCTCARSIALFWFKMRRIPCQRPLELAVCFLGRRTRLAWPNGIKSISVLTTCTSRCGSRRPG